MATSVESAGIDGTTRKTTTTIVRARGKKERREISSSMFERHKCDHCGRKFRKIEELMQHQQLVHEQRLYVCNRCNASFEGMEQMRDHARKFHSYHKRVS